MITTLKSQPAVIHLGLGITSVQAAINEPLTVWLDTLYRQGAYTFMLTAPGAVVTKISNYEYALAYPVAGSYQVTLTVNSTSKSISLQSNILSITIT